MPGWGWICVGIAVAIIALGIGLLVFLLLPDRRKEHLLREGKIVVARILLASPALYDSADRSPFGFALVVFTLDNDSSPEHLAFLKGISEQLERLDPRHVVYTEEQTIARSIHQMRTIGTFPIRIPERITGGRIVYFATPSVMRRLLPESCLTLDYLYLKVIAEGEKRGLTMIESARG